MQIHIKTILVTLLVVTTAGVWGCGEEEKKQQPSTYQFPLEVSVTDKNGEPVAGAAVVVDGSPVGYTDRDGLFQAAFTETKGTEVTVSVEAPKGYQLASEATTTQTMQITERVTGEGMTTVPISLQAQLVSTRKDYLLWVTLDCDGDTLDDGQCTDVPVLIDGEEVARTNDDGIAHLSMSEVPGASFELSIDTPEYEGDDDDDAWKMKPEDPSWDVELSTDNEVLLVEERFTDPAAAERAKRRARRAARRRAARRRAASRSKSKSEPKKTKKKEEDGVIQLW